MNKEMKELCLDIVYIYGADRCDNCHADEYLDMYREPDHRFTDAGFPDDWGKWTDADWYSLEEGIRLASVTISELIRGACE